MPTFHRMSDGGWDEKPDRPIVVDQRKNTEADRQQVILFKDAIERIKKLGDLPRQSNYAVYRIGYNRLLDSIYILMGGLPRYAVKWTKCPWPEGARCVHIRDDPWSKSFLLTLEHESFPETPEGMPFPVINTPYETEFEVVKLGQPEAD